MKRLNFNIKDRKILYGILGIVFISIFTLTVAYAALNAVLDISGSAQVSSAEWDVHFDNVKVTNGSVSGDDPRITSTTTATFSTVLNMPGEFYEFTIDVVNDGSIDAMIENITKTPTLTSEQAKYLKYDITYQNGESITTKQLVEKESFVRLKVRLEYRNDITSSDLPISTETLTLGLQLDYTQSDGSGSVVSGNGRIMPVANGDINTIGTVVTIGSEQFYTIGTEGDNVKLLSMYNLNIGNFCTANDVCTPIKNPTGMQDPTMNGRPLDQNEFPRYGTVEYGTSTEYAGSVVEGYVNEYKERLEIKFYISIIEARIIMSSELANEEIGCDLNNYTCENAPEFIYSLSYWGGDYPTFIFAGGSTGPAMFNSFKNIDECGVRPVIVISKDYFPKEVISFTIGGISYQADVGMTWSEWIDSEYNIDGFKKDLVNNLVLNKYEFNILSVILNDVIVREYAYNISNILPPA